MCMCVCMCECVYVCVNVCMCVCADVTVVVLILLLVSSILFLCGQALFQLTLVLSDTYDDCEFQHMLVPYCVYVVSHGSE